MTFDSLPSRVIEGKVLGTEKVPFEVEIVRENVVIALYKKSVRSVQRMGSKNNVSHVEVESACLEM